MIGSVPERNRGVATGSVVTIFGLSNVLGIALANVLMSVAFNIQTGLVTPSPSHPSAFVGAINVTFSVTVVVCLVAFVLCLTQQGTKKGDRPHP